MNARQTVSAFLITSSVAMSSGCVFIPKDGPEAGGLVLQATSRQAQDDDARVPFALVSASPNAIRITNRVTSSSSLRFSSMARGAGPDVSVGIGDILAITVFEGEAGGLFVPKEGGSRQGNYVAVPNQQVDARGTITIPYVQEPIFVAGRTGRAIAREIAQKLSSRAIEPQVVVSVVEKRGNDVSVLGDVDRPTKFSLDPGGSTLLAAIARAGGPKNPPYEEIVSIQRQGQTHRALLSAIISDPHQNVPMRPGDIVFVSREQRVFMVLGATPTPGALGGQNNRRFPFGNEKMSLSEALATAGGLDSLRADPHQVFLFRYEPRPALEKAGIDISMFNGNQVPTVYMFDMSQGGSFFLADELSIRDKDLIFVSDSSANDVQKILSLIDSASRSAYYGAFAASR